MYVHLGDALLYILKHISVSGNWIYADLIKAYLSDVKLLLILSGFLLRFHEGTSVKLI